MLDAVIALCFGVVEKFHKFHSTPFVHCNCVCSMACAATDYACTTTTYTQYNDGQQGNIKRGENESAFGSASIGIGWVNRYDNEKKWG